ncbi:GAP family protein [Microbacterium sp. BLY]|uniref:GAP family protein n=1 Tax=Microbacterium sp. BLY TaxID=2823280 RepID=UPI001B31F202|nr:GAP family protein [Microbacterium sp. BLY]MBP3978056.1 GAP family protein [Microbacterium sp. BLY]
MGAVIGETLPLAVGVAISPVPIIAAILMLLSPKARATSVGFLLGWVGGIVVAVTVFTLLSGVLPAEDPDASRPVRGVIQLILGALLIALAIGQWRKRPKGGEPPVLPAWMKAIDTMSFGTALGLGLLLSAVNPKNLLLTAAAGIDIGGAELSGSTTVLAIGVFTLIGASTVALPVVGYLFAASRLRAPLDSLRRWLAAENTVIMAVLLLVIGVSLVGKGLGSF